MALTINLNNVFYDSQLPPTIFQACSTKKIFIPRFCHHYSSKIAGNCRMCLIEEKSSPKPLASCAVTLINGHTIYTNTEVVRRAREGVSEYLSINHPLDCPICDQGGECDSQDQTMVFGADRGRFYESKRSTPNKNLGFLIKTFSNRCIHCARCTRFLNEIAGTNESQLLGRGYKTEISNYTFGFLKSEISGNIVDPCPVGALTSKPYAFRARPWELFSVYTYDILDGFGSNIQSDFRGLDLMRILPKTNRFLNEEWISDKTRFSYDSYNIQRLTNIYSYSDSFQKLDWIEALILLKNIFFFKNNFTFDLHLGDFFDLESGQSIKNFSSIISLKIKNDLNIKTNVDIRNFSGLKNSEYLDEHLENIENFHYYIIDCNLRFESPILNSKLRKIFSNHENNIFVVGFSSNFNFDFLHLDKNISKIVLNSIIQNEDKKLVLSTNPIYLIDNSNFISHNITNMVLRELNLETRPSLNTFNFSSLNLGQPENSFGFCKNSVCSNFLHHVEEDFVRTDDSILKSLIPTSFYYEKPTTYLNNSSIFSNMLTHFSVKIPNTKPEWKIIDALNEFSSNISSRKIKNSNFFVPRAEFRLENSFSLTSSDFLFLKTKKSSLINNLYSSNVVSRLSQIMSLCSHKLVVLNDYTYNITN